MNPKLEIRPSRGRGLGVYTNQYIEKGELIECVKVVVIPRSEVFITSPNSVLRHYVYSWNDDNKIAFPTGYGAFYNHSYSPNAIHMKHLDINEIHIHAMTKITKDEEIFINYGGVPDFKEPLWFSVK